MAGAEEQGSQPAQGAAHNRNVETTPNKAPNPDREHPEVRTGAEVLSDALNALDEALAAPITPENQQAWRTRVNGLKAQVMSIRRERSEERRVGKECRS